ncbi:PQQ-binding-like beta-propeller repeat protein [Sphingobium sp. H39-3-25]|uniref:outer membrane protein assembly factor BamB family protein n=1 Tax=Sphingobium arseniciresistens TaxID=3030834 RepID=UPI0023B90A9F|nr:PQQ-binding-like beta-propeller repeat protein [Sphingobium arseniciresistens]
MRLLFPLGLAVLLPVAAAMADGPASPPQSASALSARGAQVFQTRCAMCHENPVGRTPSRAFLRQTRSPEFILSALTTGVMRENAEGLSLDDKRAVATYLIGFPPGSSASINPDANRCKLRPASLTLDGPAWNGWSGSGVTNARFQQDPGFSVKDLPRLKLKWAFAYPGGVANEPTVVGDHLFVSSMTGIMFALNAKTGCTQWSVNLGVPARAMASVGKLPSGKPVLYTTDWHGNVYALDTDTGAQIWKTTVEDHRAVRLTGSPTLYQGRLYVPVSSGEEAIAPDPHYPCCSFRGSLVALDAASGKILWKTYTIDEAPRPLEDGHRYGPSGAAVWMAPTVDAKRKVVYIGTGDDYSNPVTKSSDAIIAIDMDTGAKRWTTQIIAGDTFQLGCDGKDRHVNCPTGEVGSDYDFGSSVIIAKAKDGSDVLVATSKSSTVSGLDPDTGKVLWEKRLGRGGELGGIEWGASTDGHVIYAPVGDTSRDPSAIEIARGFPAKPGVHAISADGQVLWYAPAPQKPVCSWEGSCRNAFTGASALIPGAVFAGSWDGHERAFSTADGKILWDFDTGRTFDAVNGAQASGGTIDHGAQVIAGGMLYVNSGGRQGHPGNALLAFSIDGK